MRIVDVSENDRKWATDLVDWLDELFELQRDYGFKELADMFRRFYVPEYSRKVEGE